MAQIADYAAKTTPAGTDEYILQETGGSTTKKITHTNFLSTIQAEVDANTTAVATALLSAKTKLTLEAGGFWGDILWKDADEIVIKPKPYSGIDAFIGCILNDGTFLELAAEYTVKYDVPGSSGHIIDGITAKLNNEWFIVWGYEDSSGDLEFGITWQAYTTFSNANPTTTLTLNQVNSQDIGFLFPEDSHVVIWQDTDELETPFGYNDGTTFTYDLTNDTETSISSRTATVLTLGGTLNNTTFTASSTVYQVDGFKPLQVSDGAVASVISTRGYKDIGFRFLTDGSGNILNFKLSGSDFCFDNGTGAADYNNSTGTGIGRFDTGSTYGVDHIVQFARDKAPIIYAYTGNTQMFFKGYWNTYGSSQYYFPVGNATVKEENLITHGLLSARAGAGVCQISVAGYKLR